MRTENLTNIYYTAGEVYSLILSALGESINPESIEAIKVNSDLSEITKTSQEAFLKIKVKR